MDGWSLQLGSGTRVSAQVGSDGSLRSMIEMDPCFGRSDTYVCVSIG